MKDAFVEFIHNVPFCRSDPVHRSPRSTGSDRQGARPQCRDHGFNLQADICGVNIRPDAGGNVFDVIVRRRQEDRRIEGVRLPMPGRHNVQNALAAVATTRSRWAAPTRSSAAAFGGDWRCRRRFTKVGEVPSGAGVATIIDDYGHHPVEIRAVLGAARQARDGARHRRGPAASLHPPARPDG